MNREKAYVVPRDWIIGLMMSCSPANFRLVITLLIG